jgi:hypothetical protein
MTALRDEIVGHCTTAVMGLIGMLIYSTTYAIVYAGGNTSTPAILEMWMSMVHVLSSCGCCLLQTLLVSILHLERPIPFLAQAQTAVFLGVACTVITLSVGCLNGSATAGAAECAAYYGAAMVPKMAAAGALVWSIIMYCTSLGCQPSGSGALSLGLGGTQGVTAAATMAMVPWIILKTLVETCGDAWRLQVCSAVVVTMNANATESTVTADCSRLDAGFAISLVSIMAAAAHRPCC